MAASRDSLDEVFRTDEIEKYDLAVHLWATGYYSRDPETIARRRPYLVPEKAEELKPRSVEIHTSILRKLSEAALN